MKVGDLVKYLHPSYVRLRDRSLGIVVEVASGNDRRVKWFCKPRAYWVSQKNLEIVNESR
jgi:hypothetical protein